MNQLNERMKKIDVMENDYKSKLQKLENELDDYKTRDRSPS